MPIRLPLVLRRLIAPFTLEARDTEFEREMAFHIEAITQEYIDGGMAPEDARSAARARFGSLLRAKEQGHEVRSSRLVEHVLRDSRHMARGLRRSPGFTAAVVLTLAVGIGGNTAIFSVVDQVMLRPLPYPGGDQLLTVYENFKGARVRAGVDPDHNVVSPANWLDWQRQSRTIQQFAAWRAAPVTLTGAGDPVRLEGQVVSAQFFPLLGVRPLLGRTINEDDDRPNAPPVAVISFRLWQTRFSADRDVVGRIIRLNERPAQIVGVMPESFRFIYPENDVWVALQLNPARPWREEAGRFLNVVARLRPTETITSARTEMTGIARGLESAYVFNRNTGVTLVPMREELTGQVSASLLLLYGAVGVFLAIACFNVTNLLLARAAARRRELAIRIAIGAGRTAIVRQLVVESLLLAIAGGVLGILLARWSLNALLAFAPADLLRVPELYIDRRVLLYALGLSSATGLIVGLAPALLTTRQPIGAAIRMSGSSVTHAPRMRQVLVACQVAMTVILLCGAGLLVRTIVALNQTNSGVDRNGLLTMDVSLPAARYSPEQRVTFYREALAQLGALPGVESVGGANSLPVIGSPLGGSWIHRLGTPEIPAGGPRPVAMARAVTAGYFRTLRIPVLKGREFTEADDANPTPGYIVNESFVRAYLADVDPLTTSFAMWMQEKNPYVPIIGVVGDVSEGSVRGAAQPTLYYSQRQMTLSTLTLFLRADRPAALASAAVGVIRRLDSTLAVSRVRTLDNAMGESLARERLNAVVSSGFALSGLLLASLGIYGLLSFVVSERTKEIGIRIALGADVGRLIRSVVGSGLRLVAVGAVLGVAGAFVLLRSMRELVFQVDPGDPSTYVVVLALLAMVALMAAYIPARRAARVEPLVALRQE